MQMLADVDKLKIECTECENLLSKSDPMSGDLATLKDQLIKQRVIIKIKIVIKFISRNDVLKKSFKNIINST